MLPPQDHLGIDQVEQDFGVVIQVRLGFEEILNRHSFATVPTRALIREPELVIADHPTSLQDAGGAQLVCDALAEAATANAAVVVFGRDPALRAIAEERGWRQLGLVGGKLLPLAEIALEGTTIDELLVAIETAPLNLVPFPSRTAGVA